MTRYDALVVGARCAGAATAMLMARMGLKVLVIDRSEYGADTLSTHAILRGGVMQLHRWGLLPRIIEEGTPSVRAASFSYGPDKVEVAVKPSGGLDALYAPRRTVLDRVVVDAARDAGAEVMYGCSVLALKRRSDGRVCGATVRHGSGAVFDVDAGIVIGADGMNSTVARLVDASPVRQAKNTSAVLYAYHHGLSRGAYEWFYMPGVSAGIIPTNDDQCCVFVLMPVDEFSADVRRDMTSAYFHQLSRAATELGHRVAEAPLASRVRAFAGRKGYMRKPCGPGWALVGDAGYFKDPITAHGITDAFRDAELVARAVVKGTEAALTDYWLIRDELSASFFQATDIIAGFSWDLEQLKKLHKDLNEAAKEECSYLKALPDMKLLRRAPETAVA